MCNINWAGWGTIIAFGALLYSIWKDLSEKRRSQAFCISTWIEDMDDALQRKSLQVDKNVRTAVISNASKQPIYDVVISVDIVSEEEVQSFHQEEYASYYLMIPPGDYYTIVPWFRGGTSKKFNTSISFRDTRGRWWTRDGSGKIKHSINSLDLYNIKRPIGSETVLIRKV